jgi:hypothetical protein
LWRIHNQGPFAIEHTRTRYLRFLRYTNHGWQARNQAFTTRAEGLSPNESWDIDLRVLREFFVDEEDWPGLNADFPVLLFFFERKIDAKPYLLLEPLYAIGNGRFARRRMISGRSTGCRRSSASRIHDSPA